MVIILIIPNFIPSMVIAHTHNWKVRDNVISVYDALVLREGGHDVIRECLIANSW